MKSINLSPNEEMAKNLGYHKSNGITSMKKHVKIEYNAVFKKFLDDVTNAIVVPLAREPTKKRTHVIPLAIFEFFLMLTNSIRIMKHKLVPCLTFFKMKGYLPMRIVESIWLQRFACRLCPRVIFRSKKVLVDEILLGLVDKMSINHMHMDVKRGTWHLCYGS